jgi:monoamine oxidase
MTVLVVGAGLAGLTAARILVDAGQDVRVLEAHSRVGGRTHGIEVAPGTWADAGAAYLGTRHTALTDLISRNGLSLTPTTMLGDSRFALRGAAVSSASRFPPLNAAALGDLFEQLDELVRSIDGAAPWAGADAQELDTTTAASWAARRLAHPDARLFFPLFIGEMMAADPKDISVLHMAFYLRSGGGIRYLNAFEGGAQAFRIREGAHTVCERLAAGLGGRVSIDHPVLAIEQDTSSVRVHTPGAVFTGTKAIVAVPPLLAQAMRFEPPLSAPRAGPHTAAGCVVKVHLIYASPLWRGQGLSGWSVSAAGPLLSTVDDSPADGSKGILTGFITGSHAHEFAAMAAGEQRAAVMAQIGHLFPDLPAPEAFHVTDWLHARYSKGCYAALFGPGDWLAIGPHQARAEGRIHWAGTETSTEFFGLMEGAIRSGERAAREVLAAL